MKKYIKLLLVGAVAVLSTTMVSCSGDFLDTKPTGAVATSGALGTTANAAKAINGISALMCTQHNLYGQGFCGENGVWKSSEFFPSQNFNYNYYANGWAPIHNQEFYDRKTSVYDSYAWYYYYSLVGGANAIIAHIDAASGSEEEKAFVKAQALTFRAYSFEKLMHYYCHRWQDSNNGADPGIILRLDESTGDAPLSTMAECYAQIYKDCQEAVALFEKSGISRDAAKVWLPTKNVAYAVWARAALTRQDYGTALEKAKLAEEGYPLMSNSDYQAGFCRPTSEWLFGSFGGSEENMWYYANGVQFACNGYYTKKTPCGAGTIGRDLINRIPNNDARKALFLTEDKFPGYDFGYSTATNKDVVDQTYGIFGGSTYLTAKGTPPIVAAVYNYIQSVVPDAYSNGYAYLDGQLKFQVFEQPGISYLPFIRTSEMVLIEAEANYFLDRPGDAQAALVKLNKTSGRNTDYTCTKTGQALFDEIVDYRCLELWGEGSEWSDFKRWKKDIVRKGFAQGGNAHASVAKTISGSGAWTWIIPQNETDYNSALKDSKEQ